MLRVAAATEEKLILLSAVFAEITATSAAVRFAVRGQPFPIEAEWSAVVEVAGPGLGPATHLRCYAVRCLV
jgi:hypothetical protein